jgi:ABC-type lipoprotein export system ATPase subunit
MDAVSHSDAPVVIAAKDLWKSFDRGRIEVIRGASVEVRRGEVVGLWGASGSGKSTLLHLLSGLDVADQGSVTVLGLDPQTEKARLALRRKHVGFVFQLHHLIPDLTLEENLRIPSVANGASAAYVRERIAHLTDEVGLSHRLRHRIQDLSGGERQRTAICRALVHEPEILFADEPTGSLDEETGGAVFELLWRLARKRQMTVVLATHERRFMESCSRVIRVSNGRTLEG